MAMELHELIEDGLGVDENAFTDALRAFVARTGPLAVMDMRPADHFGDTDQRTLRRLGLTLKPLEPDELGPVAGLAAAYGELVAKSITVPKVAKKLAVDESRVRQRIHAGSLYAFKQRGTWAIPAFQFTGKRIVAGLDSVVPKLSTTLHPVAVSRWFSTPDPTLELDGTAVAPLTWLSSGGSPDVVAELASSLDQL